jgi:D-alanine-D-alanine ligase
MRIGITYDLKSTAAPKPGQPDDLEEEFDSPATVEAVAAVLRRLGHTVEKVGNGRLMLERVLRDPPDFVFNFAEGRGVSRSREARVPAVLEMLGIPYTGSDPLTLAVTLDKDCAKRVVASEGVPVPRGVMIHGEAMQIADCGLQIADAGHRPGPRSTPTDRSSVYNLQSAISNLQFPLIVKPAWEGSSKGVRGRSIVDSAADLAEVVAAYRHDYRQPILVEEFIDGDELTIGVIGNDPPQIIGVMRVLPQLAGPRFVYTLEVKRDFRRLVSYECPAKLPAAHLRAVEDAALKAYRVLGCRDVSRVDFRLRDGVPYFLEVNPLPGINPESSDLVILAELARWSYEKLIGAILQAALDRYAAGGLDLSRRR